MRSGRRMLILLLVAFVFGVAMGTFKGDNSGLRSAIGNLSAPWLLVAFIPAVSCRTTFRGACSGLATTMVALVRFYAAVTTVLAGHLGGGGAGSEFLVEVGANRIYFLAGLVTGPLFGALGSWAGRRHPDKVMLAVGGLLAGEILVVALVQGHQLAFPPLYFRWGVDTWRPYVGEFLLGVAVVTVAVARTRHPRRRSAVHR